MKLKHCVPKQRYKNFYLVHFTNDISIFYVLYYLNIFGCMFCNCVTLNQTARDEANSALDQLHEAERELKSLRIMAERMILTQEEMV